MEFNIERDIAPEVRGQFDDYLFDQKQDPEVFREWARNNPPEDTDWGVLQTTHPYCRDEWFKQGLISPNPLDRAV